MKTVSGNGVERVDKPYYYFMQPERESPIRRLPSRLRSMRILSRENLLALFLCLLITLLIIMASDIAPQWIYQGF